MDTFQVLQNCKEFSTGQRITLSIIDLKNSPKALLNIFNNNHPTVSYTTLVVY